MMRGSKGVRFGEDRRFGYPCFLVSPASFVLGTHVKCLQNPDSGLDSVPSGEISQHSVDLPEDDVLFGEPSRRLSFRELAHARTGDKGDTSNISVIAYDPGDFAFLAEHVTAARVQAHFAAFVRGLVTRYELPKLGALNFVLEGALGGGVTRSLAMDTHGKSLSSSLLELELPDAGLNRR